MNQAPPPPQLSQQQPQQATSFSSGLDISNDYDNRTTKQSSVKLERKIKPVLEETNITSQSKDEKASNKKSSPKKNGNKNVQTPKYKEEKAKEPKQTKSSNTSIDEKNLKSSLDVARKCRNDFPPFLTSTQEKSTAIATKTTTTASPNLPPKNQSEVPEFQTLTLRKTPKGKTESNDPRFIPVKSPREELLSSIQNMGGPKMLKTVQGSSASHDKRFSTVESPREDLLSSIRNSQGLKSLKPIQESVTRSPIGCNGPPPPPPPVPVTKQLTASQSQPSKFITNVEPRDDLLSAIRNSGGVKSLKPVKR